MSYVAAGLLSGLGQGLSRMADTLEQRRREALAAAREEAARRFERDEWTRRNEVQNRQTTERDEAGHKRDIVKLETAHGQTVSREREERDWRSGEADAGRRHQSSENAAQRQWSSAEAEKEFGRRRSLAQLNSQLNRSERDHIAGLEERHGKNLQFFQNDEGTVTAIDPRNRQVVGTFEGAGRSSRETLSAPDAIGAAMGEGGGGRGQRTTRQNDEQILSQYGPVVDRMYGRMAPQERLAKARELAQKYGGQ